MVDGFVTDITEQRQEAEQRETALRLQAVGRLTGGIAHDFNNLLTVIIGNLELARSTGQASTIEDALEASDRASKLTRQLLTFARSQESEAETVDLVPQVTVLSRLLSRTLPECLTLTVDHEAPSCIAAIPASDLDQIVLNLVVNARDALGADQGRIRVSTRMEETEGECFAILLVADDGPGLDPSVRDSLFEPFVSTRDGDGGLGLGLSIVRDLVSRTGGRIDVRSDPVDGTCFEVRLPVTAPTGPAPALSDLPVEGDGTILVVDDDPAVRRTVTLILEGAGFRVIEASGLSEAQAALDPSLRAIVTDVLMQDGSGFDVLETVEQRKLAVPCILISGYPDQVTRHQGNVHASVPILSKPFRAQELLALLRERLHAR
jgi:CheY-like chemotaxis protein/two-component sensor histidine kinase